MKKREKAIENPCPTCAVGAGVPCVTADPMFAAVGGFVHPDRIGYVAQTTPSNDEERVLAERARAFAAAYLRRLDTLEPSDAAFELLKQAARDLVAAEKKLPSAGTRIVVNARNVWVRSAAIGFAEVVAHAFRLAEAEDWRAFRVHYNRRGTGAEQVRMEIGELLEVSPHMIFWVTNTAPCEPHP